MINSILLKHFKCFDQKNVFLNRLTILAGANSTGKSSVIQALSALMQTAVESRYSSYLALNGQYVSLGSFSDVVNVHKGRGQFTIGLEISGSKVGWTFDGDAASLSGARIKQVAFASPEASYEYHEMDKTTLDCLTPTNTEIAALVANVLLDTTHLTADRYAGHEIHNFFERRTNALGEKRVDVGPHGEATMSLLMTEGDRALDGDDPRLKQGEARSIVAQSRAWMADIFPGASIDTIPIENSAFFRLRFQTNPADKFRRPESVGYGYAQVFPLIVLGLAARSSNTLLIENPEVHLHPAAQSKVGRFLAKCAAAGIQLIVETHSDHIINGIRLEVAEQRSLAEHVTFYSVFANSEEPGNSDFEEITIDEKGRLSNWPKGFFDQASEDARKLVLGH